MLERLLPPGSAWKVYNDPTGLLGLSPLPYFAADVKAGTLPSVSWIIPPLAECEHPAAPPEYGEYLVQQILGTLVANPAVWAQTVFIVVYDETGGSSTTSRRPPRRPARPVKT